LVTDVVPQVFAANLVGELRTLKMLEETDKFELNQKLMSCQKQLQHSLDEPIEAHTR